MLVIDQKHTILSFVHPRCFRYIPICLYKYHLKSRSHKAFTLVWYATDKKQYKQVANAKKKKKEHNK